MTYKDNVEATYIAGKMGPLFALHRAPLLITEDSECFILVPSFAEEMNRCRYMCTLFSQGITRHGHGFLSVDLYGTGDSGGEFVDADWNTWRQDVITACDFALKLGYRRVSLLAIRIGALLAMDVAKQITSLHRIVLWQPVISGNTSLIQFLRIRIAASIERDEVAGTVKEFESLIEQGKPVQVAGYDVSPALYDGIKSAHMDNHLDFSSVPVAWFSTLASEDRKIPRTELDFLDKWRGRGANIYHSVVIGPSYWAVHERTLAPALVHATVNYIAGPGPHD